MTVIAIDGPAGSGKSTIARLLAERLDFQYLDTGAMYRAVALAVHRKNLDPNDEESVRKLLPTLSIDLRGDRTFLNAEDVSHLIRTPEIDLLASTVSKLPCVREFLTKLQRDFAEGRDIVAEGRDMGTVVFPEAPYKFFLTASPEERARRRKKQLETQGEKVLYETILYQIKSRDKQDSGRSIAPLKVAKNAVVVDTTGKTIEEVLTEIIRSMDRG
ncbi:Cytidylate kinase [Dissulfuribacter thermophilus]|uniref:Cytidylate kinase n=1 Tax=Dissulfuribacter thermophilus TaxID=1156395 RepID=A0A1B9F4Q1_9BACT|nr:(d)CMP kinase [Dissulfuribacter thermophilus]OCC14927.1 Cytidylate kinase [Dissulfuribacter thermophilus]